MAKSHSSEIYRTRIFLITPPDYEIEALAEKLEGLLGTSDIASLLIMPPLDGDYQAAAQRLVPLAQKHEVATLLLNDSQLMGRTGADGLYLDGNVEDIVQTVKAHTGKNIMGVGNLKTRHDAMMMGEGPVDFLFFGRLDGDTNATIFPKTFKLAEWWSSLMEVPAVVMGGDGMESVEEAANAGIDFLALQALIWRSEDPIKMLKAANEVLDDIFDHRQSQKADNKAVS